MNMDPHRFPLRSDINWSDIGQLSPGSPRVQEAFLNELDINDQLKPCTVAPEKREDTSTRKGIRYLVEMEEVRTDLVTTQGRHRPCLAKVNPTWAENAAKDCLRTTITGYASPGFRALSMASQNNWTWEGYNLIRECVWAAGSNISWGKSTTAAVTGTEIRPQSQRIQASWHFREIKYKRKIQPSHNPPPSPRTPRLRVKTQGHLGSQPIQQEPDINILDHLPTVLDILVGQYMFSLKTRLEQCSL